MNKKHLVVLTGAGISAESGLQTFRDADGLWNGHNVYEVATPGGFNKNPEMVLEFYNKRRKDVAAAEPNAGHKGLADLEDKYNVTIITQNIDNLHERAGSTKVVHLHGEIFKKRSAMNPDVCYECNDDILVGELAEDGSQMRPYIVWFEEEVPMMEQAKDIVMTADIFVIIGTSLQVYPAASLIEFAPRFIPKYVIDRSIPHIGNHVQNLNLIEKPATEGVKELKELLGYETDSLKQTPSASNS